MRTIKQPPKGLIPKPRISKNQIKSKLNKIAKTRYGEFGFDCLSEDEKFEAVKQLIDSLEITKPVETNPNN